MRKNIIPHYLNILNISYTSSCSDMIWWDSCKSRYRTTEEVPSLYVRFLWRRSRGNVQHLLELQTNNVTNPGIKQLAEPLKADRHKHYIVRVPEKGSINRVDHNPRTNALRKGKRRAHTQTRTHKPKALHLMEQNSLMESIEVSSLMKLSHPASLLCVTFSRLHSRSFVFIPHQMDFEKEITLRWLSFGWMALVSMLTTVTLSFTQTWVRES